MVTTKSRVATLSVAAALLFGLVAQPASAQDEPTLHIGILAPLSGPFERLGRQIERGVGLAVERARLDPEMVQITAVDDGCDESRGRDAANQLIGAGVDVVVGGVCWRPAVAARDVLAFEDIPFVSSGVRYGPFTDDADGPVWRVNGRDDVQAQFLANALVNGDLDFIVGGVATNRPITVFFADGTYGRPLADGFEEALAAAGIALALKEAFEADDDLDRLARRAEAEGAGLVVLFAGQADSALLADALRTRLPDVPLLSADSVMTAEFRLLAASGGQGVVFARPTPWQSLVGTDVIVGLTADNPQGADGLVLPSIAAGEIAIALLDGGQQPYDTILGRLTFSNIGDAELPSFQLWQWLDGHIWPFQPDTGLERSTEEIDG